MNDEIAEAIASLWPTWKPSPAMLALWSRLLDGIGSPDLARAVLTHAQRSPYPPTVADLLALAGPESSGLSALEAWGQLEARVVYARSAEGPAPELDPRADRVAEMLMGNRWRYSSTWAADRAANRARFFEAWKDDRATQERIAQEARSARALGGDEVLAGLLEDSRG